jgi:RecB family exonuclease
MHYVLGHRSTEFVVATAFGTLLHEVLEKLFRWVLEEEYVGLLPEDLTMTMYREAWSKSGLTGLSVYQEGINILRAYVRRHAQVDHFNVLGVEVPFDLQLEEFRVEGRIDRIDRIDDETIEVIDFKSNRSVFTSEELASDLQMSVYGLAVKKLFPWAERVRFSFDMLRHGIRQPTERTEQELNDAKDYIVSLGRRSESGTYPAKVNSNCGYCDHRARCVAYQDALSRKLERVAVGNDLEKIAIERDRMSLLAKSAYARLRDLDEAIRPHLEHHGDMTIAGITFRLTPQESNEYPVRETVEKLVQLTGKSRGDLVSRLTTIHPKRLEQELSSLPSAKRHLAQAELDILAQKVFGFSRIQSTKSKGKST